MRAGFGSAVGAECRARIEDVLRADDYDVAPCPLAPENRYGCLDGVECAFHVDRYHLIQFLRIKVLDPCDVRHSGIGNNNIDTTDSLTDLIICTFNSTEIGNIANDAFNQKRIVGSGKPGSDIFKTRFIEIRYYNYRTGCQQTLRHSVSDSSSSSGD